MIDNDTQMKMIVANMNDKMASITNEVLSKEQSYAKYVDEKLKSIEWDIKVLRNRVDYALKERNNNE